MAPPAFDFKALHGDMLLLVLYHYLPNRVAAIAAAILYAVVTLGVAAATIHTRSHYMWTVTFTGLLELTGEHAQQQSRSGPKDTLAPSTTTASSHLFDHAGVFSVL